MADVTAVFVNNKHDIQRRGQDLDNKFYLQSVWGKLAVLNTENIKIFR